jgi:hypothetical protein
LIKERTLHYLINSHSGGEEGGCSSSDDQMLGVGNGNQANDSQGKSNIDAPGADLNC